MPNLNKKNCIRPKIWWSSSMIYSHKRNDKHVHDDDFFVSIAHTLLRMIFWLVFFEMKRSNTIHIYTRRHKTHSHTQSLLRSRQSQAIKFTAKWKERWCEDDDGTYSPKPLIRPKQKTFLAQSCSEMMWNIATLCCFSVLLAIVDSRLRRIPSVL